jgi:hypothetical protein
MSQSLALGGEPQQLRLKWEELGARLPNKKIAFVLPDGTRVEGKVLSVQADGLQLKVSKSSDKKAQPKGKHLIPRASISVVQVTEYRKIGRLVGTAGAAAIAAGILAANYPDLYEGPAVIAVPVLGAAGSAGAAVAGYYAGKAFDKRVTQIRVEPVKQ